MKKLLVLLLLALPALGDVTITNTYTDGQAARITKAMARVNKATCAYRGLPANCTTVQVREQFCKTNGIGGQPIEGGGTTPLVSDCNGATQFIVYNNITVFEKRTMLEKVAEWANEDVAEEIAAAKANFAALTQPQKDAVCASLGLAAGCSPF